MTGAAGSSRSARAATAARAARHPVRLRSAGRRLAAPTLALLAVLATGLGYGASHLGRAAQAAAVAVPTPLDHSTADPPESLSVAELKNFALNALLIPLIDDGAPPAWLDPFTTTALSIAIDCTSASVTIDGRPLVPSTAVPARAFTMRWRMDHCVILNGSTALTGVVELLVFHDGDRYSASVRPIGLHVVSSAGDEVVNERFSATTPLTPTLPP